MLKEAKNENIVIGPPPANGEWELTPQPSDALDAAGIVVLEEPEMPIQEPAHTSKVSRLIDGMTEAFSRLVHCP